MDIAYLEKLFLLVYLKFLLFAMHINDLPHGFILICKIFADNASIFSKAFFLSLDEISVMIYPK